MLYVRFSNRPFGVKRFQTIHHHNVDDARGLVLLSESAPRPFHHGIRRRGGTILGRPCRLTDSRSSGHTNLPHPSSREDIIPPLGGARVSSYRRNGSYAAATSLVQRNSVPSTHMRCIITAKRRPAPRSLSSSRGAWRSSSPGLEPGPLRQTQQHDMSRFVEHHRIISSPHFEIAPVRLISPD